MHIYLDMCIYIRNNLVTAVRRCGAHTHVHYCGNIRTSTAATCICPSRASARNASLMQTVIHPHTRPYNHTCMQPYMIPCNHATTHAIMHTWVNIELSACAYRYVYASTSVDVRTATTAYSAGDMYIYLHVYTYIHVLLHNLSAGG